MDPEPSSYIILVVLLLLSGVFSGSETALVSLTPAKIKAMQPGKHRSTRLIQRLKESPQKMLTTILLGNNVVNIAATAYATVLANQLFGSNAITIVTAVMTAMVLIFGEILPKAIANRYSFQCAKLVVYPLLLVEIVFFPVIWVLEKFISTMLRFFGQTNIQSVTEEELKAMVLIGAEEGALKKQEQKLIENVLEFDDTEVDSIMTPRVRIDAISGDKTVVDAIKTVIETGRSRLPVFKESIDNLIGVISAKDLLALATNKDNFEKKLTEIELGEILRCPITRKINSLFNELRQKHLHIAFVYDEHGGLEGLATMEDILEEIVGEILDEFDNDEEQDIVELDANTLLVRGEVALKDILDVLPCEVEEYEDNDQISWIILDKLNRYPEKGEKVKISPTLQVKVEKIEPNTNVIERVRITRK